MAGHLTKSIKIINEPQDSIRRSANKPLSTTGYLQRGEKSDSLVTFSCQLERSSTPPSRTKLHSPVPNFRPNTEEAYREVLASLAEQATDRSIHASCPLMQEIKKQTRRIASQKVVIAVLPPESSTATASGNADRNNY